MNSSPDTAQLRRYALSMLILIAFAVNCGRIISVQRVYEPAFHRDADKQGNRKTWPATRPDANSMFGSNDRARWATVRALVHDHTYVIGKRDPALSAVALFGATDPLGAVVLYQVGSDFRTDVSNPLSHSGIIFKAGAKEHGWATIDRIMNPDTLEFLSSKPPLLSTIVAAIYWIIFHVFGLSLIEQPTVVVRVILFLINGLPFAGYLWLLMLMAERWCKSDWGKLYIVGAGAFATTVSPFLITLNNHTIGTFAVMLAWWSVLCVWDKVRFSPPGAPGEGAGARADQSSTAFTTLTPSPSPGVPGEGRNAAWQHFAAAGFFASFAAMMELPALAFAVVCFLLLLWWRPRSTVFWFVPAALIPAAAFFATNYIAMGQLRPAQSEFGGPWYEFEGSYWNPPLPNYPKTGIDWARRTGRENAAMYAVHVLVGHHGLFTLTPIWLLALAGMIAGCWRWRDLWRQALFKEPGGFPWFVQPLGLALTVVVVGFYLYKTDNYGGFTNGLRWLMWLTPIWLTCLMPAADWLAESRPRRWLGGLCLAVSIFSMSYQLWSPWRHPWIFDLMLEFGWPGY